ncbi:hypothetical protein K445DRAFT_300705 [Daldinia sp. EC12]|nr:hypothetical protein K445DRAFT_300705 [Daldinia sp. EC12]
MKFPSMSISKEGWRRTGLVNIAFVMMAKRGSALNSTTIILEGDCQKTRRANSVLHILISLTSTLILASSRFFMHILSSPSRLEINRAHLQLQPLDIGISSMRNLRFISIYKSIGWAILLISSTPIHLLFNSSIFETHFQNSDWRLTVASSSFSTYQVDFFPPGASLANAGSSSFSWNSSINDVTCRYTEGPKNKYRDVVVVVDTQVDNPGGWTRSQVFSDPSDVLGPIWDSHIPPNDLNSLWYSTQCNTSLPTGLVYFDMKTAVCRHNCARALGFRGTGMLTNESALSESEWVLNLHTSSPCSIPNEKKFGYNDTFNRFPVRYCLAEPSPISQCYVGLSNILLLVTTSCVFLKALVCTVVVIYLPHASLITLGDALESFISDPDPVTMGLGTFNIYDSQSFQLELFTDAGAGNTAELSETPQPRAWSRGAKRLISVIPKHAWSSTIVPIVCVICVGMYYAYCDLYVFHRFNLQGNIGTSETPFFVSTLIKFHGYFSYFSDLYDTDSWKPSHRWGMIEGTVVVLGYWPLGIIITLSAGLAMAAFPILYGLRRHPGNMVFGACDSLVLSAACHPYVPSSAPDEDSLHTSEDLEREGPGQVTEQELLRELSRGKLRWGVTRIPYDMPMTMDDERNITHLSFTSEDEFISEPVDDNLYV